MIDHPNYNTGEQCKCGPISGTDPHNVEAPECVIHNSDDPTWCIAAALREADKVAPDLNWQDVLPIVRVACGLDVLTEENIDGH